MTFTRLAMGRMTSVVRSPFSPAQPCARRDVRFSQGRWRDALFEGPFGRRPGRTKLRSQAAIGPAVTHRGSRGDHPPTNTHSLSILAFLDDYLVSIF